MNTLIEFTEIIEINIAENKARFRNETINFEETKTNPKEWVILNKDIIQKVISLAKENKVFEENNKIAEVITLVSKEWTTQDQNVTYIFSNLTENKTSEHPEINSMLHSEIKMILNKAFEMTYNKENSQENNDINDPLKEDEITY